ncbi:DNA-binding response regulator, LytR/AlgR family [Tenacibaculum sp. MAR_2010_89]|uniref:LytR/AlgR family response regulator transcription factor n=1 Tax=Tenacibaculum sp. MAR_2010_89 TaxID=1250198 RepID=UPI000897484A|nr:response regulator transcription factor [Tenacibaculum sp. MAR_2010_89]SEE21496.1 DNA-binding response regulator, LytR/AlgR family [Tenacibaculum sp. MAR_2010_89]
MERIKILILEDSKEEAQIVENIVSKHYDVVGVATNYNEAVAFYHLHKPDLAILDVFIEGEREGTRFATYINENRAIPILFLTSAKDKISFTAAKSANPHSYLLKPIDPFGIKFTIELAFEKFVNGVGQLSTKEEAVLKVNEELFIKKKDSLFKISKNDVCYIEVDDKYCHVYTKDAQFLVQKTLKSFAEEFKDIFIQTHRRYLINRNQIERIDTADYNIILKNKMTVPLSQRHKKEVLEIFTILK